MGAPGESAFKGHADAQASLIAPALLVVGATLGIGLLAAWISSAYYNFANPRSLPWELHVACHPLGSRLAGALAFVRHPAAGMAAAHLRLDLGADGKTLAHAARYAGGQLRRDRARISGWTRSSTPYSGNPWAADRSRHRASSRR